MITVAALYVARGGVYWDMEGVDPWDERRDARLYMGPHSCVVHSPCGSVVLVPHEPPQPAQAAADASPGQRNASGVRLGAGVARADSTHQRTGGRLMGRVTRLRWRALVTGKTAGYQGYTLDVYPRPSGNCRAMVYDRQMRCLARRTCPTERAAKRWARATARRLAGERGST